VQGEEGEQEAHVQDEEVDPMGQAARAMRRMVLFLRPSGIIN
jgi:hypothetical protein